MDTATMDLKLAANIVFDQLVCCYISSAQWGWLSSVEVSRCLGEWYLQISPKPPDFLPPVSPIPEINLDCAVCWQPW